MSLPVFPCRIGPLKPPRTLLHLPLLSWSSRFRRGTVRISGTKKSGAGVCMELHFVGGAEPRIVRAAVGETRLTPHEAKCLVAELNSPSIEARAVPDGDLWVAFGGGVEVRIPAGSMLEVSGSAVGDPDNLTLGSPLVVSIGDAWLRLSKRHFGYLSRLAKVRITRATLHPDGSVDIEGGARRGLDRAVRGGLERASARVSTLVRSAPQFSLVRAFLTPVG
jgi:hypothetical protein